MESCTSSLPRIEITCNINDSLLGYETDDTVKIDHDDKHSDQNLQSVYKDRNHTTDSLLGYKGGHEVTHPYIKYEDEHVQYADENNVIKSKSEHKVENGTNDTPLENEDKEEVNDLQLGYIEPDNEIEEEYTSKPLIYSVNDNPPLHITIICALQQCLLSLALQLIISLLVAETVCASDNNIFKARLLSSTLFMSGVTTVAMTLFGIRLPLFQGAAPEYVIMLLMITNEQGNGQQFCTGLDKESGTSSSNANSSVLDLDQNITEVPMDKIINNVRALQGSLMVAGFIQAALGFTGLVGLLIRFVGPLTVVPTMILLFTSVVMPVLKFVQVNWGIAFSTIVVACILFLYLSKYNAPVPVWTPSGGFRIIRYPLHQVFAILISILINWGLCGVLTYTGALTDDPKDGGFATRTDARSSAIANNPWFSLPYPGQYGPIGFSGSAFLCCLIAVVIATLDSVGDYYACAKVCRVPAPPIHAVNRGICIEGMCSMISGAVGVGHATTTYAGNIGAIGVTKVASRRVFLCTGIFYMLFGIFGKFSAIFITIPYPVLGGATVVMFGIFFGLLISNLEVTHMSSPRNNAILGLSVFVGLLVPKWTQMVKTPIHTGSESADKVIGILMGNPSLVGSIIAFFLDNTVPGTKEERGMTAWHAEEYTDDCKVDYTKYDSGYAVYRPLLPERVLQMPIMKYIPILPYRRRRNIDKEGHVTTF